MSFLQDIGQMISASREIGKARVRKKYPELYLEDGSEKPGFGGLGGFLEHMEGVEEFKRQGRVKALQGIGSGVGSAVNWVGSLFK